jgi:hypothetical protein
MSLESVELDYSEIGREAIDFEEGDYKEGDNDEAIENEMQNEFIPSNYFSTDENERYFKENDFVLFDYKKSQSCPNRDVKIVINDFKDFDKPFHKLFEVENLILTLKEENVSINLFDQLKELIQRCRIKRLWFKFESERIIDDFNSIGFYSLFSKFSYLNFIAISLSDDTRYTNLALNNIIVYIGKNKCLFKLADGINQKIKEFKLRENKKPSLKVLIQLGRCYTEFWYLAGGKFISLDGFCELLNVGDVEKNVFKEAEGYHLYVATTSNKFKKDDLKKIIEAYTLDERNRIYYRNYLCPNRIIDNLIDKKSLVDFVNQYGFDPRRAYIDSRFNMAADRAVSGNNILLKKDDSDTFAWKSDEAKNINNIQDIICDALAFTIQTSCEADFVDLFDEYYRLIDINQPIQNGLYRGYSVIQIICLYWDNLNHDYFSNRGFLEKSCRRNPKITLYEHLERLFESDKQAILNTNLPKKNYFYTPHKEILEPHPPLTLLHYLVYAHHDSLLFKLLPPDSTLSPEAGYILSVKNDVSNEWDGLNLLTLFIKGIFRIRENRRGSEKTLTIESLKILYQWLMKDNHKLLWAQNSTLPKIIIKAQENRFSQNASYLTLPLLGYVLYKNSTPQYKIVDELIADYLFDDFFSTEVSSDFGQLKSLNFFHFFTFYGHEYKKTLEKIELWLKNNGENKEFFLGTLKRSIKSDGKLDDHTLFQLIVLKNQYRLVSLCHLYFNIEEFINTPFPDNSLYKGWTPILLSIHKIKQGGDVYGSCSELFNVLLNTNKVNLDVCFPDGYSVGLNVLQAMLLSSRHDTSIIYGTGREFSAESIKYILHFLNAEQTNAVCKNYHSQFYGMTALHIAFYDKNHNAIKVLLENKKTDYTKPDAHNNTLKQLAGQTKNPQLMQYIEDAETKFPDHITNYQQGLKYNSEVNPNFQVTLGEWVVSLVREVHSHHAFLIIEGLIKQENNMKATMKLAHLTTGDWLGKADIKLARHDSSFGYGQLKAEHLLPCIVSKTPVIIMEAGKKFYPESDNATPDKCQEIWEEIKKEADNKKGILYWILGNRGFFGVSKSLGVINCVDWAILTYNKLVKPSSQLEGSWKDYFFASAKGYLNTQFNYVVETHTTGNTQLLEVIAKSKRTEEELRAAENEQKNLSALVYSLLSYLVSREVFPGASTYYLPIIIALCIGGGCKYLPTSDEKRLGYKNN